MLYRDGCRAPHSCEAYESAMRNVLPISLKIHAFKSTIRRGQHIAAALKEQQQ
jgi:hypothetical protein